MHSLLLIVLWRASCDADDDDDVVDDVSGVPLVLWRFLWLFDTFELSRNDRPANGGKQDSMVPEMFAK